MNLPDLLGNEQIDLNRLKKTALLHQTDIPKNPRIHRTLSTLDSVLNVLEEHGRTSKIEIDNLVDEVNKGQHYLTRKLHESQTQYLKLQAHIGSIQSLKECYCRYVKLLDGARTMFNAYQNSKKSTSLVSTTTSQVKLGLKECTQTLCAIEAQLESMLGTFVLKLNEITGFSRICTGDEYEIILRYGQQKTKTRGKIQRDKTQTWSKNVFYLKAKLADLLFIKVSEIKLLGTSHTVGIKYFEVNNLYSINQQRMIVNANQAATIKLQFVVFWDMYHQVDTKFTYYNPNRSYSDVTRTWSMFISNNTVLRTVNETLSNRPISSTAFSSSSQSLSFLNSKRISSFWPVENDPFRLELKQRLHTQSDITQFPTYSECSNGEYLVPNVEVEYDEIESISKQQINNSKSEDLIEQSSADLPYKNTFETVETTDKTVLKENEQRKESTNIASPSTISLGENDKKYHLALEETIDYKMNALSDIESSAPTSIEEDRDQISKEDEEIIEQNSENDSPDDFHIRSRSLSLGIQSMDGDNYVYELEMLIQQIKTCLDDIRIGNEQVIFDQLDENISDLDSTIKHSIHEQTERNLEIEDVMEGFDFLNEMTTDEIEQQQQQKDDNKHEEEKQQTIVVTSDDGPAPHNADFYSKRIDSGFIDSSRPYTPPPSAISTTINDSINMIIVELLRIILKLLHYIQSRINILRDCENLTVIKKLNEQISQLRLASLWCKNEVRDTNQESDYVKSSDYENDQSLWTVISEHLLSDLCCLSYTYIRPKHITLLQILFLLNDNEMFEQKLKLSIEQFGFIKNIVNMVTNNDYKNLALMLNRNTLNNNELIDQIIIEMNYNIPDEFITEISTEFRFELINHLKSLLNKDGPSIRLAIHKTILRVQQIGLAN
ncbi:unnamed protein product [Didymodactylos carnosus]|uniref:FAM65 N-terminal domain-containing protein n=1 Tax=Didymodactylos carnosus TaxID=1234261 RepID=A0A813W339_9BILA|nr:unnamed protein product [Didymodactylos carnosus]CAF3637762.1 unnamed protein product [Didymodactylos carnosus]